jgi:hypothetical protein
VSETHELVLALRRLKAAKKCRSHSLIILRLEKQVQLIAKKTYNRLEPYLLALNTKEDE